MRANGQSGAAAFGVAALVLGIVGAAMGARRTLRRSSPTLRAARRLHGSAGALALCVLADSGVEHYRGSFHNRAMFVPLLSATLSTIAGAQGALDGRPRARRGRSAIHAVALVTGLIGTGFHLYNIHKRPGRFSWLNLFYSAPIGAPAALSLSGLLGLSAERLRVQSDQREPRIWRFAAGPALATLVNVGLVGTAGEAGLLHLRGAYHNPAMYLPVTLPPVAAMLLAGSTATGRARALTKGWLRLTAAVGLLGAGLHAYGVSRGMGGWRNWTQNLLSGPPLPAPPSFTVLALAGLVALSLQPDKCHG